MRSSSGSREAAWLLLSLEGGAAGLTEREAIADRDGSPARPGVGEGRGSWRPLTSKPPAKPTTAHSGHELGLPGTTTTPTTRLDARQGDSEKMRQGDAKPPDLSG